MPRVATVKPNGPVIRALRVRKGLSTKQLGKMTGRHPQSIRRLEITTDPASELLVQQVANALKVDISELVLPEPENDEDEAAA